MDGGLWTSTHDCASLRSTGSGYALTTVRQRLLPVSSPTSPSKANLSDLSRQCKASGSHRGSMPLCLSALPTDQRAQTAPTKTCSATTESSITSAWCRPKPLREPSPARRDGVAESADLVRRGGGRDVLAIVPCLSRPRGPRCARIRRDVRGTTRPRIRRIDSRGAIAALYQGRDQEATSSARIPCHGHAGRTEQAVRSARFDTDNCWMPRTSSPTPRKQACERQKRNGAMQDPPRGCRLPHSWCSAGSCCRDTRGPAS
jgi:hypothetical protein